MSIKQFIRPFLYSLGARLFQSNYGPVNVFFLNMLVSRPFSMSLVTKTSRNGSSLLVTLINFSFSSVKFRLEWLLLKNSRTSTRTQLRFSTNHFWVWDRLGFTKNSMSSFFWFRLILIFISTYANSVNLIWRIRVNFSSYWFKTSNI